MADVETFLKPETKKIFVKTWGCSHNISDSEYMTGLLSAAGYQIIVDEKLSDEADLWVLNSCTVKGPSEAHFLTLIRRAKAKSKCIVAAGCVPQGDKKLNELTGISIIGVQQIDHIVQVVEQTLHGNNVQLFGSKRTASHSHSHSHSDSDETAKAKTGGTQNRKKMRRDGGASLHLPKIRRNKLIEILPINTGCLNQCTYCKTKHARGDLASYSVAQIIERIKHVIEHDNVREIWLTSEDTGAYGLDIDTNIANLLQEIMSVLDEQQYRNRVMIRLGMTNPPYILSHLQVIAKALNHGNIYAFLHIPVQSASNNVLNAMKRKYSVEQFEYVCDYLIQHVPRIHIATDFICGFPTERDVDHERSMKLLAKYKWSTINISQFYPRPKTAAARMKKLDTKIVKERSREMTKLFKSYTSFTDRIGEQHNVLITEMAKDQYHFVGHNKCFDHFLVPPVSDRDLMGKVVKVEIVEVGKYHLLTRLVSTSADLWPDNGLQTKSEAVKDEQSETDSGRSRLCLKTLILMISTVLIVMIAILLRNVGV
eukprot:CAMPEP_0197039522 /NCGR_PEP_ID=MMETSP1384-20130603/16293_1 /TAXON_ID=29189 /ORGANISM="Ammonia sp." /LENGTH=538 /DNA_ID=CAMNT_0042470131 /DNA_START=14 /DNA_END=1630 /DNA_ORIENTATION=-